MILREVLVKIYDNDYCQSMVYDKGFYFNVTKNTDICSMAVDLNGGKSPCPVSTDLESETCQVACPRVYLKYF